MKKLNVTAVGLMMTSLITANGKTSNLEIKNALRGLGYQATQDEVRHLVNEILVDEAVDVTTAIFVVADTGTYKEYSFSVFASANGYVTASVVDVNDGEESEEELEENDEIENVIEAVNISFDKSRIPGAVIAVTKTVTSDDIREPEVVYQTETLAKAHNEPEKWVAFHKGRDMEFHIYNETLNSDKVRSRYASMLKLPIADVRAKKISNFIKE